MIELLILTFIVLSVICLWILIERRKSSKFLFWFIPVLLILTGSTYWTYTSILGSPKVSIPEEGMFLFHYIDEPTWIYLWIVNKKNVPINYQIPYKRSTHQQLENIAEQVSEGKMMMVKPMNILTGEDVDGKREQTRGTVGGDLSFYEWNYKRSLPRKD